MKQPTRTVEEMLADPRGLLAPFEVAFIFKVDPKTVSRWAKGGRLQAIRTPGGHRRFRVSQVKLVLETESDHHDLSDTEPMDPGGLMGDGMK